MVFVMAFFELASYRVIKREIHRNLPHKSKQVFEVVGIYTIQNHAMFKFTDEFQATLERPDGWRRR